MNISSTIQELLGRGLEGIPLAKPVVPQFTGFHVHGEVYHHVHLVEAEWYARNKPRITVQFFVAEKERTIAITDIRLGLNGFDDKYRPIVIGRLEDLTQALSMNTIQGHVEQGIKFEKEEQFWRSQGYTPQENKEHEIVIMSKTLQAPQKRLPMTFGHPVPGRNGSSSHYRL